MFQTILEYVDKRQQKHELEKHKKQLINIQTGGESFCYLMLYNFSLKDSWARDFVFIKEGENSLFNLSYRMVDYLKDQPNTIIKDTSIGEFNAPAIFSNPKWHLNDHVHYGIFFQARNGSWTQELILKKSIPKNCWLAATRVRNRKGSIIFTHIDNGYETNFGTLNWKNKI